MILQTLLLRRLESKQDLVCLSVELVRIGVYNQIKAALVAIFLMLFAYLKINVSIQNLSQLHSLLLSICLIHVKL